MEKKFAIITGGTGGIGSGFIRPLGNKRGYHTYVQYRNEEKRDLIQTDFPSSNAHYFYSSLKLSDQGQLEIFFQKVKAAGITFDVIVLASGIPGTDAGRSPEESKKYFSEANYETKQVFINAFLNVYDTPPLHPIDVIIICSHVAEYTEEYLQERANDFGNQIGYIFSKKQVKIFAEKLGEDFSEYFTIHLEFTPQVDTPGYRNLGVQLKEENNVVLDAGMNAEIYAEEVLTKAGL